MVGVEEEAVQVSLRQKFLGLGTGSTLWEERRTLKAEGASASICECELEAVCTCWRRNFACCVHVPRVCLCGWLVSGMVVSVRWEGKGGGSGCRKTTE